MYRHVHSSPLHISVYEYIDYMYIHTTQEKTNPAQTKGRQWTDTTLLKSLSFHGSLFPAWVPVTVILAIHDGVIVLVYLVYRTKIMACYSSGVKETLQSLLSCCPTLQSLPKAVYWQKAPNGQLYPLWKCVLQTCQSFYNSSHSCYSDWSCLCKTLLQSHPSEYF